MESQVGELWSQAQCHLAARQAAPARTALEALLAIDPDHTLARLALCNLAWRQDRVREATEHALRAARSLPDYPELICETASALLRAGETVAARECLQRPILNGVKSDTLLIQLADHWHALGEHGRALAQMDHARELGFDGDGIRHRRGRELMRLGRTQEAEPELELGFLLGPTHGEIALQLSRLRIQTRERNHFNTLAGGIKSVTRGSRDHAALEFALYRELEDVGRYDDAWQALTRANAVMAQRKRCDVERMRHWFDLCVALCTRETLMPAQTQHDGPQPIFIVGLPHSGARELASCLGNHPDVIDAGDLNDFAQQLRWAADHRSTQDQHFLEHVPTLDFGEIGARYLAQTRWRARAKPFYIDSQPDNWMYAGLIRAALPHARILHVTCDPMDACFASFRAWFGDSHEYAYDLNMLAVHYRQYQRLMTHWRGQMPGVIQELPYAEWTREPRSTLHKMLSSNSGLEFMYADSASDGALANAFCSAGARARRRAQGVWRPYEAHLEELRKQLT